MNVYPYYYLTYTNFSPGKFRVRRALKKQVGGAVSVPVPQRNQEIRQKIKEMIASGKFNLGIPVLDNEYNKAVLTSEGNNEKTICKVRKYPLKEIYEQSVNLHKDLLKPRSNQEYESMRPNQMKTRLQVLYEHHENMTNY